jgi:DNA-binding NarL/FixJ family response regulator
MVQKLRRTAGFGRPAQEDSESDSEDKMSGKKVVVASEVPLYAASIQWMLSRQEDLEVEVVAGGACEQALGGLAAAEADAIVVECGGMLDWNRLSALCRAAAPKPVIVLTRQAPMETVC